MPLPCWPIFQPAIATHTTSLRHAVRHPVTHIVRRFARKVHHHGHIAAKPAIHTACRSLPKWLLQMLTTASVMMPQHTTPYTHVAQTITPAPAIASALLDPDASVPTDVPSASVEPYEVPSLDGQDSAIIPFNPLVNPLALPAGVLPATSTRTAPNANPGSSVPDSSVPDSSAPGSIGAPALPLASRGPVVDPGQNFGQPTGQPSGQPSLPPQVIAVLSDNPPQSVPEPSTILILVASIMTLALLRRPGMKAVAVRCRRR